MNNNAKVVLVPIDQSAKLVMYTAGLQDAEGHPLFWIKEISNFSCEFINLAEEETE